MMNSNRGMKKWMPFASLPEHNDYINRMMKNREKKDRPELSEYQKAEINEVLSTLTKGDFVEIAYYDNGDIRTEKAEFIKLDLYNKCVFLNTMSIHFNNILEIAN